MDSKDVKRMDIKEFREKGYLQEVNRRFLHPLGLALEVITDDETDKVALGGIWDYREDEEGLYYDLKNATKDRKYNFIKNYEFIEKEFEKKSSVRTEKLGFNIEPIVTVLE